MANTDKSMAERLGVGAYAGKTSNDVNNATHAGTVPTNVHTHDDHAAYYSELGGMNRMTPAQRSRAWLDATPEDQAILHQYNVGDLHGKYTYDDATGVWTPWGYTGPNAENYNLDDTNAYLMNNRYNYDEDRIRRMFDAATKAKYEQQEFANQQAQSNFARNLSVAGDTARRAMNDEARKAVATGGSRGMLAAQDMAQVLGLQDTSVEEASQLAHDQRQIAYDKAAEYAENVRNAEALAQERMYNLENLGMAAYTQSMLGYGYDTAAKAQTDAADITGRYGVESAKTTGEYDVAEAREAADAQRYVADKQAETAYSENALKVYEFLKTLPEDVLRQYGFTDEDIAIANKYMEQLRKPQPTYSGGYSGGGYSGGGYSGGSRYSGGYSGGGTTQSNDAYGTISDMGQKYREAVMRNDRFAMENWRVALAQNGASEQFIQSMYDGGVNSRPKSYPTHLGKDGKEHRGSIDDCEKCQSHVYY